MRPAINIGKPLPSADEAADDWYEPISWAHGSHSPTKALAETALVRGGIARMYGVRTALHTSPIIDGRQPVSAIDTNAINGLKSALEAAIPRQTNVGLYQHLDIAGITARKIAEALSHKVEHAPHPCVLEAAGYLHDVGKLTGIFRYFLTDLIGDAMMSRMGVRPEIQSTLQPLESYIGPLTLETYRQTSTSIAKTVVHLHSDRILGALSLPQRILAIADAVGKRSRTKSGGLMTFDEMLGYHRETRRTPEDHQRHINEQALWPAEIFAYDHMAGFSEGWERIYSAIRSQLRSLGIELEDIRNRVEDEYLT